MPSLRSLMNRYAPEATFASLGLALVTLLIAEWDRIVRFFDGSWLLSGGWIVSIAIGLVFLFLWIRNAYRERRNKERMRDETLSAMMDLVKQHGELQAGMMDQIKFLTTASTENLEWTAKQLLQQQEQFGGLAASIVDAIGTLMTAVNKRQ